MARLAIIYFSQTETTHNLACAVGQGACSLKDVEVVKHRIQGPEINHSRFQSSECFELIDSSDAVIFGSPTYMGGPASQFKAFADASSSRWDVQRWADKLAAGFTVGANPNGDQLATLLYFSVFAAQHGMIWVGLDIPGGYDAEGRNRLGTQLGVSSHALTPDPDPTDMVTAQYLGRRLARMCARVR